MVNSNYYVLEINDINELAQPRVAPCISIYAPVRNGVFKTKEGPVRFSNQIKSARKFLKKDFFLSKSDIDELLAPALALADDHFFWKTPADGVAAFLAPGIFRKYRLPIRFTGQTNVGRYFDLKPLFPLLAANRHYYLLLLNKKTARLFSGSRYGINEIRNADFPKSGESFSKNGGERHIEAHSSGHGKTDIFHGQGGLKDAKETITERFFRSVNRQIKKTLMFESAPLLIAAQEKLVKIYEKINEYQYIVNVRLRLDIEPANEKNFALETWKAARPHLENRVKDAIDRYRSLRGTPKISDSPAAIIPAAAEGRVESLFAARDTRMWGKTDPIFNAPTFSEKKCPDDEDLAARAILNTFLHSGHIYVLPPREMPFGAAMAAIFRY